MVNIAMLMATGAEQGAMPHLPGASTAGVAPVTFLKSFEGSVGAGFGKSVLQEGMPAGVVGVKSSALRIGLICVENNETSAGTKMPTEAKEPGGGPQLSLSRGSETSVQETVAAGLGKDDLTRRASAVAVDDVALNPKVLPAQRLDTECSITSAGQERRSEEAAATPVREPRRETAAKAKPGGRKDEASSDAPAVPGDTADMNMLADPFALSLAGQPAKPGVAVAVPSSIVQPVKDSKDVAEIPNALGTGGAAGGAKKRIQSLKASASPREKLTVAGAEGRSGKTTLDNDGVRDKGFHADDLSRFSAHETSAATSEGTGKPDGFPGSEVQAMPLSPLMKDQTQTLTGSSAGRQVSISGSFHPSLRGEAGEFEQPVASAGEHRALTASPTMLEVGVSGGSHGWLKIRAELAGDGAVHASVSSSSTASAELLRREIPSLTTYLHQEQVALGSLVVHASAGTQDTFGMSSGFGNSAGSQQQTDAQQGRSQQDTGTYREWNERPWSDGMDEDGIAWLPHAMNAGGGWLSVRA
jgi:hypothetical protein